MNMKDLGYEFTDIPCVELITIQQTQGIDGPYVEIVMKLRAFDAPLSFDAEGFNTFVENMNDVLGITKMMNAQLRYAGSAEREGRALIPPGGVSSLDSRRTTP